MSLVTLDDPENPGQTYRIYLSLDTTKGSHIIGVKATELTNPETVIVSKEAPIVKEDSFNAEEWLDKTFGEEVSTPIAVVQETTQEDTLKEKPIEEKKLSVLQVLKNRETIAVDPETSKESKEIKNSCKTGNTQEELTKVGQTTAVPKITRKKR
jgi:hypothetical protein